MSAMFSDGLLCVYVCVSYYVGEACWWTIHPASKQRSEGEKVRVGDDLILVSVSSERYLVSSICLERWIKSYFHFLYISFVLSFVPF